MTDPPRLTRSSRDRCVGAGRYGARMRVERLGVWRVNLPSTRAERRRGLLGRGDLGPNEALWLQRCRSVHTFGMTFAIDVVLLDRLDRPVGVRRVPPGRLLLPRRGVRHIVEVAAGRGAAFSDALAARTTLGGLDTVRRGRT